MYSVHQVGQYSVLCMPYSGAATLASWLDGSGKRNGQSLIETVDACQARIENETIRNESSAAPAIAATRESPSSPTLPSQGTSLASSSRSLLHSLHRMDAHQLALWLGSRLAAALAHAHARGIAHGDIKPANILLRNDGEPTLIDFNLARTDDGDGYRYVGGTLPYMAPEQLQALMGRQVTISASADVYALGLVLYEILFGQLPLGVPRTLAECDLQAAIQTRKETRADFSASGVPAGLRAIVEKCLAYEPTNRYPSGKELFEDLDAQSHHRPLLHAKEPFGSRCAKLARRYPRAFSTSSVSLLAAFVCLLVGSWAVRSWQRAELLDERSRARAYQQQLVHERNDLIDWQRGQTLPPTIARLIDASADRTNFSTLPVGEQSQIWRTEFETSLSAAWLIVEKGPLDGETKSTVERLMQACRRYPQAWQSSELLTTLARMTAGEETRPVQSEQRARAATDIEPILIARAFTLAGQADRALEIVAQLEPTESTAYLFWLTTGAAQLKRSQAESARLSFSFAIQARPLAAEGYYQRAQAAIAQNDWASARDDCTKAIELNRDAERFYAQRALVLERLGELALAIEDIDRALSFKQESTRLLYVKSRLYRVLGNKAKAAESLRAAEVQAPITAADWISKALTKAAQNPQQAVSDIEQALRIDPNSVSAWQNLAYIHSEILDDDRKALEALDMLLSIQPDHQEARGGRSVVRSRLGMVEPALEDLTYIQSQFPHPIPATAYQMGCAAAQLSTSRPELRAVAMRYLMKAIQQGYGADLLPDDEDLDPIRKHPEYEQLLKVVELLKH